MKRLVGLLGIVMVFALLSGCATLGRATGFTPQARESFAPQEPWHNVVVQGHLSEMNELAVSYIPVPQPVPERLKKEFIYARYVSSSDGKEEKTYLQRWTFRGLMYRGESFAGMYDVFFDQERKVFIPLLPLNGIGSEYRYIGDDLNFLILSSSSTFVVTTSGKVVELLRDISLLQLPDGFFREHSSGMPRIATVKRSDPEGREFFARLESEFSRELVFRGKKYSGRGNAVYVHDTFTATNHVVDRLISCGALTGSWAWIHPVGFAISAGPQMIHNARVIAKENCDVND